MAMTGNIIRVLLLEDSPAEAERIERELRKGGVGEVEARRVETRETFERALDEFAPDVILSNRDLSGLDGLSAIRIAHENAPDVPVIIVTDTLSDEANIELVKAGASDYVLKDRLARLPYAIRNALATRDEIRRRERADRALKQSEERFRSLVETAGDWIWATDEKGVYTYVSPRVEALLGYAPDELVGRSRFDFMPPAEAHRFAGVFADIRDNRRPFSLIEITAVRKDGRKVTLETSAVPILEDRVLKGYRGIDRDVTEHKAAEQAIAALAHTDALTGLANRAAFLERLRQDFARARRTGDVFSVLSIDLDHFKDVNDTLGHPAGDRLLKEVGGRLREAVRESDMAARFGGDEFAVLQTEITDAADAGTLASKIREAVSRSYMIDGSDLHITASVGIALYRPELTKPAELLAQADLALYRAKDEGRDCFAFHTRELSDQVRERVALAEDLRAALEGDELALYYQPQVAHPGGRIVGLEALLRWHHPRRGMLLPDAFIPVAERRGLARALGHWVLDEACRQIHVWRAESLAVPAVAINLSATQFKVSPELRREVADALARHGLAPEDIELEITGATLMETARQHGVEIAQMGMLGLRFALDDFGAGYTSLDDLLTYRFTRLNIARRFVGAVHSSERDAAIVRATIGLARELGIGVIAEGVETKEQMDFLADAGCAVAQGFYFSPPVPAETAAGFLRRGRIEPGASASPPGGRPAAASLAR